uniref:Uncharacterized protein n=1 Tax=Parascaris univalens TaxID=6257 RepID=A0A915BHR7_PARUN
TKSMLVITNAYSTAVKTMRLNLGGHTCKRAMSHEKTYRNDFFDVMCSVSRYANNIRKQRQRTSHYNVALESALDSTDMSIDDAMSALDGFISGVDGEFNTKLCEIRKKRKETLRVFKNEYWSLSAAIVKQKAEIDALAEQCMSLVDLIETMQKNFYDAKVLTNICLSFEESLSSLQLQVKSHCLTSAPLSDEVLQQTSDFNRTIPMILSEILLMIHRLKVVQKLLELVQLDEHPKSSEITSLIEKAYKIEKLLQISENFSQRALLRSE